MNPGFRTFVALGTAALLALAGSRFQGSAQAADLVSDPAAPSGLSWPCSSFSPEQRTAAGVDWSYRVCGSDGQWSEIDFRFHNAGPRDVVIGFQAWLARPRDCSTGAFESGRAVLPAGETSPWANHLYRVRTADFDGTVWLCAREIEEVS